MSDINDIKNKINKSIDELNDRLIERDQLVRLSILALFCKSHMFLIGERGVGKSLTIRLLGNLIKKAKYWELQVGTDTETKQLFGEKRVSENGTVYYEAKNTVLDAHIVFLDEMFKAKSEVLNTLLQLMADKYYTTGDGRMIYAPMVSLIGASNEYPSGKLAEPYLDRLLFWYEVERIKKEENRLKYFNFEFNQNPIEEEIFTLEEIDTVYKKALSTIVTPPHILKKINKIINAFLVQSVKTSDRKYLSTIEAMKVSSFINGRDEIDYSDLFLFLFTSWHNHIEKRKVEDAVFYELFKDRTTFEKYIENLKSDIEKIESYTKGELHEFLNHKIEFNGEDANENFFNHISLFKETLQHYDKLFQIVQLKKDEINEIYKIENMVLNNIFLNNINNKSLNQHIVDDIEEIETLIVMGHDEIEKWLNTNKTIIDYKKNALSEE